MTEVVLNILTHHLMARNTKADSNVRSIVSYTSRLTLPSRDACEVLRALYAPRTGSWLLVGNIPIAARTTA